LARPIAPIQSGGTTYGRLRIYSKQGATAAAPPPRPPPRRVPPFGPPPTFRSRARSIVFDLGAEAAFAREAPTEPRSHGLTRRRGERGVSQGAEGCSWFCGAAETARRTQGSRVVVVCSGRAGVRGVKPASPGRLSAGMSMDPTGRNHIHS